MDRKYNNVLLWISVFLCLAAMISKNNVASVVLLVMAVIVATPVYFNTNSD